MKNNETFVYVSYWDDGLKDILIPVDSMPENDREGIALFIEDPWCDECMELIGYLDEDVSKFIPVENGNEDFSWNPFHVENHRNILEIIFLNGDKSALFYSFLEYTLGGSVLGSEDFMFKHKIAKSKFKSYLMLRHIEHNTTLIDILNSEAFKANVDNQSDVELKCWNPKENNISDGCKERCKDAFVIVANSFKEGHMTIDEFMDSINFIYEKYKEGD